MHVKEIYVIFIHSFDSGILLIIDLNKKKRKKGWGVNFICEFYSGLVFLFQIFIIAPLPLPRDIKLYH
jgi:hypothetical protein